MDATMADDSPFVKSTANPFAALAEELSEAGTPASSASPSRPVAAQAQDMQPSPKSESAEKEPVRKVLAETNCNAPTPIARRTRGAAAKYLSKASGAFDDLVAAVSPHLEKVRATVFKAGAARPSRLSLRAR